MCVGVHKQIVFIKAVFWVVALTSVLCALDSTQIKECYKDLGKDCGLWTKGFDQIEQIVIHPVKIELTQEQIKAVQGSEEIKGCLAWHFTPKSLKEFFRRSETYPISPRHDYDDLICHIKGSFMLEGQKYTFDINGGGHFEIYDSKGKVYYLGCSSYRYTDSGDIVPNPKCAKFLPDF
ncbi:hypothetical protein [Helicobacter labacensis]|uniref:hypothetical protein n=1 Tax=Helicobacter labacensis TaxID=2316079 RepID=UPI000EB3FAD3|nr:hypothetical protein [Helicobacter labacensis]